MRRRARRSASDVTLPNTSGHRSVPDSSASTSPARGPPFRAKEPAPYASKRVLQSSTTERSCPRCGCRWMSEAARSPQMSRAVSPNTYETPPTSPTALAASGSDTSSRRTPTGRTTQRPTPAHPKLLAGTLTKTPLLVERSAMATHVHAFRDDALGADDAVAVAARIRAGEISAVEAVEAAIARIESVEPELNAVVCPDFERARKAALGPQDGPLAGVPTIVKDNADMAGLPTGHGTSSFVARPAHDHGDFVRQYLAQGMVSLGKSRLPEFGFNASTEFADAPPTRNPWNTEYSPGASSGGSAALVAAGALPIAHANDGGGSIRFPAAAWGLVGLKPTRGRTRVEAYSASDRVMNVSDEVG